MNDLIKIENVNGEFLTTSRNIAEVFGKEHYHVLESIRKLDCSKEFGESNFRCSSFLKLNNKKFDSDYLM